MPPIKTNQLSRPWNVQIRRCERLLCSVAVTRNLGSDPLTNWYGHTVADHSISIIVAAGKAESIRHALQSRVFSDGVWADAVRETRVGNESSALVFSVVRNAGWCDVAA